MPPRRQPKKEEDWRKKMPKQFSRPTKRQRKVPNQEMIIDLAKDYSDSFMWWRQQKKRLII